MSDEAGKLVEVGIEKIVSSPIEVNLEDGTRLILNLIVVKIQKDLSETSEDGNPAYKMEGSIHVTVEVPNGLVEEKRTDNE